MITNYNELPIGIYERILALSQTEDNDLAIIAALSGKTEDELLNLPIAEYRELADAAAFLFTQPVPAKVRKEYGLNGTLYRLTGDAKKLTTAQYIDFKEYAKAGTATLADYLSIILVPDGKVYGDGYDTDDAKADIRDYLPVTAALGIRDFFTQRLGKLMLDSLTYSRTLACKLKDTETRTKLMKEIAAAEASLKNGDGLQMLIRLQSSRAALGPRYIR